MTQTDQYLKSKYRNGYPTLTNFLLSDEDQDTLIFRKFGHLGVRTLLYRQSELITLEAKLQEYDTAVRRSCNDRLFDSERDWDVFQENSKEHEEDRNRLDLVNEIEAKLKQYHKQLFRLQKLTSLGKPHEGTLQATRAFVLNSNLLGGRAKHYLSVKQDLVALKTSEERDILTRFLRNHWIFPLRASPNHGEDTRHFSESTVAQLVTVISLLLAAILMIAAIVSLYVVKSPKARLGMISTYTVVFSVCISVLTKAKRSEMFAATAAYAAVLVVFVSGNLGAGG